MDLSSINWIAVIVATIAGMALGFAWFSPILFLKPWMKELKLNEKEMGNNSLGKAIGLSALLTLIAAVSLAMFIGPEGDLSMGTFAGFMAGATFVATFNGIHYLYESKSLKLFLITAGYSTAALTLMGAIIGLL